jgi:hypothetical protein
VQPLQGQGEFDPEHVGQAPLVALLQPVEHLRRLPADPVQQFPAQSLLRRFPGVEMATEQSPQRPGATMPGMSSRNCISQRPCR